MVLSETAIAVNQNIVSTHSTDSTPGVLRRRHRLRVRTRAVGPLRWFRRSRDGSIRYGLVARLIYNLPVAEPLAFVIFDLGMTEPEAANLQEALDAALVHTQVSTQPYSITASAGSALEAAFVVVSVISIPAFLGGFATRAGQDTYDGLKRFVSRLRSARNKDAGRIDVIIRDEVGPDIVIGSDVPLDALGRLLTEPLPPAPSGTLVFDLTAGVWRDSTEA